MLGGADHIRRKLANSGSIRPTTMLLLLSHRRIQLMRRIRKGQFGLWRLRVQGGGTAPIIHS